MRIFSPAAHAAALACGLVPALVSALIWGVPSAIAIAPLVVAPWTARAATQAGGDQRALDSLGPSHASSSSSHRAAQHRAHAARHARTARAVAPTAAPVAAKTPPIPARPPPPPVFKAPVIDVPLHPEPPPPPVPVVASATGSASSIGETERITFGSGSPDFNASMMAALQAFAARLRTEPEARAEIDAYAGGTADDPSTPRRMSLARGLAARAVLINAGIPSTRIYVRVIGQPHDDGPADRVDLTSPEAAAPAATPVSASVPTGANPGPATPNPSNPNPSNLGLSTPDLPSKAAAPP